MSCDPIVDYLAKWPTGGPFLFVGVVIFIPWAVMCLVMFIQCRRNR